ncbi:hypothetical protein BS47DRAFT_1345929 [Hydnum rufescens UP504]|uniref:Uncharacterized protein n=1 Tax=Hydnum rufescens UP504 TaxID=1448309 RepID=A0A9P6DUY6_9AGAM|nr:hypothetical protein BS47DRAFT_1345929 [Hydnum rufescens UP504]
MQAAPSHAQVQPVPQPQAPRGYNQVAAGPVAPANPVPPPSKPVPSSAPRPQASGPSTSRPVPRDPVVNVPSRAKVERSETPPVRSASASMETVERAIGDLRISTNSNAVAVMTNGGGARGHHRRGGRGRGPQQGGVNVGRAAPLPVSVPKEDFDFERANSKFDKASLFPSASSTHGASEVGRESPEPGQIIEEKKESTKFYDKSRSFFDDISSDSKGMSPEDADAAGGGRGRGGYGGRGRGRSRREDERNKNLSTFGETGMNLGTGTYWPGGGNGGGGGGSGSGFRGRRRRPYLGNGQPRQSQQQ